MQAYNNTGVALKLESSGLVKDIPTDASIKFKFTGDSFSIKSSLGDWKYPRNIPYLGEGGPYFDGVLRMQINENGTIYLLKVGQKTPKLDFKEQPSGYPLLPLN